MNYPLRAKPRESTPDRTNHRSAPVCAAVANLPVMNRRGEISGAEAHLLLKQAISSAGLVAWTGKPRSIMFLSPGVTRVVSPVPQTVDAGFGTLHSATIE